MNITKQNKIIKKQNKIKVIIFDFIGVLLFTRHDYKPEKIIDEIDNTIGRVTDDEIFRDATQKEYRLSNAEFDAVLKRIVNKYEPLKLLWALLPNIKQKYKLAIINNGTSLTLPQFKNKYHLNSFFKLFVSSAIEGLNKPNRLIYELTMSRLNVKPEECLFMDDSLPNINTAKNLGMSVIYWKNPDIGFKKFEQFLNSDRS